MDKRLIDQLRSVFKTSCAIQNIPRSSDEVFQAYMTKLYPIASVTSVITNDNDKLRTVRHTCDDTWQVVHEIINKRTGHITYINQYGAPCDKPDFLIGHDVEAATAPIEEQPVAYCPICDGNGYHSHTCPRR